MKQSLSRREREVFEMLTNDKTTREIALKMSITDKTVRNHISHVMAKVGARTRSSAVVELIRRGEIKL